MKLIIVTFFVFVLLFFINCCLMAQVVVQNNGITYISAQTPGGTKTFKTYNLITNNASCITLNNHLSASGMRTYLPAGIYMLLLRNENNALQKSILKNDKI